VGLDEYNRKRNFAITSEPPGKPAARDGHDDRPGAEPRSFVIQKHAASRLHYDFRLELSGVLKSWSVPKGPSLDPTVKRLAMEVEDHPIEYATFEGIIPKGQYGGGTVLLWDRGVWAPVGNPHKALADGNLKFVLQGEKLEGAWALVKLKGRPRRDAPDVGERGWLLIKERDPAARPEREVIITDARPESVATRRTLDQIAADKSQVWHSDRARADAAGIEGARPGALPAHVAPQAASLRRAVPEGDGWLHEVELEGERILCRAEGGRTQLLDAGGQDWTARAPEVAGAANLLPAGSLLVDGTLAALLPDGSTRGTHLAEALRGEGPGKLTYFAFDVLHLDGQDLTGVALERRKDLLRGLVARVAERGPLRYADHIVGGGAAFLDAACALGAPGVVSKQRDASYRPGPARSTSWLIVRCGAAAAPPPTRRARR
jgi:bifunctional non-homologous end joining protein LigD